MTVLHLNTHTSGGSYEYAALLSTALAERGIESEVLCKNSIPAQSGRLLLDRIIRRSYVSLSTEPWHGTRRLLPAPAPEDLQEVDVVHLHTVADWFNVPSWLTRLPTHMAVVISVHDMWHVSGGCFLYRGCDLYADTCAPCPILKQPFNWVLAKDEQRRKLRAYRDRRARFVASSQWLADLAQKSPIVRASGRVRVIPPAIDTDVFRPQEKAECRAKLGIAPDVFVIAGGAASLTDTNKNIPWLLEQLARLPELEKLIVLLAGESAVEIPARPNVRMIGGIADRTARGIFYGAADVFVSASLMETYGFTLIEAMSCGVPVVAFRTGGIPEAVSEEGGILCALLDADAFRAAIQKLRNCEELRNELGNAASKLVATRNAKSRFGAAFARVYEACLYPGKHVSLSNQP